MTFSETVYKEQLEQLETITVGDVRVKIVGGGPYTNFPLREMIPLLRAPFNNLVRCILWLSKNMQTPTVSTGARIVRMTRTKPIPRSVEIGGFLCKVWYKGQPIECDICGLGHVAKDCPVRG